MGDGIHCRYEVACGHGVGVEFRRKCSKPGAYNTPTYTKGLYCIRYLWLQEKRMQQQQDAGKLLFPVLICVHVAMTVQTLSVIYLKTTSRKLMTCKNTRFILYCISIYYTKILRVNVKILPYIFCILSNRFSNYSTVILDPKNLWLNIKIVIVACLHSELQLFQISMIAILYFWNLLVKMIAKHEINHHIRFPIPNLWKITLVMILILLIQKF